MFKLPLVFLLFLAPVMVYAGWQPALPANSALLQKLKKSNTDTSRIKLQLQLASNYLDDVDAQKKNLDTAANFINQAKQLAFKANNTDLQNSSLILLGRYYILQDSILKAKAAFKLVTDYYQKTGNKQQEAVIWSLLGTLLPLKNTAADKIACFERARNLFVEIHHPVEAATALRNIAEVSIDENKTEIAERQALQALAEYKTAGYKKLQYVYDVLARVSEVRHDERKQLYYRIEAVKLIDATQDSVYAAYCYHRLASVYATVGMYEQSLVWVKKAIEINKATSKDYYTDALLLVTDMTELNQQDKAVPILENIIKRGPPRRQVDQYIIYGLLAEGYAHAGQKAKAEDYSAKLAPVFNALLPTYDEPKRLALYRRYYKTLAEVYVAIKEYQHAEVYLKKIALLPQKKLSASYRSKVNLLLFKVDSANGNYVSAIKYLERHKTMNDSIYNAVKNKQVAELQIKYETSKKEQSIKVLQSQAKIQHAELQHANLQRNITFGGIAMLLIIAGVSYTAYRQKQQNNLHLQHKQKEINQQNDALQRLLKDKDKLLNEKDWLLKEVHHRVKNNLQIIISLLNTQAAYLENKTALSAIKESQNRVQAISLIHQKLYKASNVASIDMPAYIYELANYLQDSFNTAEQHICFQYAIEPINMDITQAIPIGLIVNEAVTNAIKYAFDTNGGNILIALETTSPCNLRLSISDNGNGLPPNFNIKTNSSLGMEMMKALSKQLGGSFQIKSDQGTTLLIDFQPEEIFSGVDAESISA
ncbi:tetratricopeptide repeat-containing sensor histidine kinase [Mucilaginibacter agri]|uniref:Histidine kinase domain-containing protein n=1 Tax=Mucilaginibacter agri TaxID=2695265 RepID=A0A965ZEN8_9SPHI|nr:sensor histidine kinase [Mucilaginibacter agri]NCD68667.1 hypothetical protein [Mucilaginibacter agri]